MVKRMETKVYVVGKKATGKERWVCVLTGKERWVKGSRGVMCVTMVT